MTVFVLLALVVKESLIGPVNIDGATVIYKDAESCLKNIDRVKKILLKEYDQVYIKCEAKEVR